MTPDRALALTHFPAPIRPAVEAIWRVDATLAEVVAGTTEPAVGAIRLAWWREALERLDHSDPPAEPRLADIAQHCLPRGVTGAMIAEIEDGYAALLEEVPDSLRIGKAGAAHFAAIARLIGEDDPKLAGAGALAMLARVRGLSSEELKPAALQRMASLKGHRFARPLRPLTNLARLAARDFLRREVEPEATPGRAFAMLSHRLSGVVTGAN
ncbi:squalene/phytoene synthase family protein [Sphingomicrobium flavum]|uniref:squalene/phytoene synthase family protein n=1 Tax=Sphingomicrobium flavum TaxID=1229164 RepID=UPI0021AE21DB|nr:squalene/phytoene synthase family protein [Sphingomicrobium flavum]